MKKEKTIMDKIKQANKQKLEPSAVQWVSILEKLTLGMMNHTYNLRTQELEGWSGIGDETLPHK